jgi:hypothetical protein
MVELSIDSEKVTEIPVFSDISVVESAGVVEETVGGVVSIVNVLIFNILGAPPAELVTVIVQLE